MEMTPVTGLATVEDMSGTPSLPGLNVLGGLSTTLVTRVREWPVESQLRARRNALVAATACVQRRAEREDVDDFLETMPPARTDSDPARRAARG